MPHLHNKNTTQSTALSSPTLIKYMKAIAIFGQFPSLFQIIKTLKTQSSGDISIAGLGVALFCALSWLIYALKIRDQALILSSILSSFLSVINLLVTIKYH
ncbi:MAG: hypothetical protein K0M45_01530 [Candidatus Paracaedibacteraceae bacterium]|nr:hypothetical protein [Candidatus Paracaedibacteraceae bacterium]